MKKQDNSTPTPIPLLGSSFSLSCVKSSHESADSGIVEISPQLVPILLGIGNTLFECWVKPDDYGVFAAFEYQDENNTTATVWLEFYNDKKIHVMWAELSQGNSGGKSLVTTENDFCPDGQWHHVACYLDQDDPSNHAIFIDGIPMPVKETSEVDDDSSIYSITWQFSPKIHSLLNSFLGEITEIRFWQNDIGQAGFQSQIIEYMYQRLSEANDYEGLVTYIPIDGTTIPVGDTSSGTYLYDKQTNTPGVYDLGTPQATLINPVIQNTGIEISADQVNEISCDWNAPLGQASFTIETWVKVMATSSFSDFAIFYQTQENDNNGLSPAPGLFSIIINADGSITFTGVDVDSKIPFTVSSDYVLGFADGNWHHIAVICGIQEDNSVYLVLSVDGVQYNYTVIVGDPMNLTPDPANPNIVFGTPPSGVTLQLASTKVWNQALSQAQLAQSMITLPLESDGSLNPNLLAYWSFQNNLNTYCNLSNQTTINEQDANFPIVPLPITFPSYALQSSMSFHESVILSDASSFTLEILFCVLSSNVPEGCSLVSYQNTTPLALNWSVLPASLTNNGDQYQLTLGNTVITTENSNLKQQTTMLDGSWHHGSLVYLAAEDAPNGEPSFFFYLDGKLIKQIPLSGTFSTESSSYVRFGNDSNTNELFANIAIWDIPLTSSQIQAHQFTRISPQSEGLVTYFSFDYASTYDLVSMNLGDFDPVASLVSDTNLLLDPMSSCASFSAAGSPVILSNPLTGFTSNEILTFPDTSPFTIMLWTCLNDDLSDSILLEQADSNNDTIYSVGIQNNQVVFQRGSQHLVSQKILWTNQWVHIALVYDGGEMQLYLNGVLDNTSSTTNSLSSDCAQMLIGAACGSSNQNFNGEIQSLGIYNSSLSQDDIQGMMYTDFPQDDRLIGYWNFIYGTLIDFSGNGNDGSDYFNESYGFNESVQFQYQQLCNQRNPLSYGIDLTYNTKEKTPNLVQVASESQYDFQSGYFSIECWVCGTYTGASLLKLLSYESYSDQTNGAWVLSAEPTTSVNSGVGFTMNGETTPVISTDTNVLDGNWHHIVVTYGINNVLWLYVDGVLQHDVSADLLKPIAVLEPGYLQFGDDQSEIEDLLLTEVRLWNTPLTAEQIYLNMYAKLIGNEYGLVGYWNFESQEVVDLSLYNNQNILQVSGAFVPVSGNSPLGSDDDLTFQLPTQSAIFTSDDSSCSLITTPNINGSVTVQCWMCLSAEVNTGALIPLVLCVSDTSSWIKNIVIGLFYDSSNQCITFDTQLSNTQSVSTPDNSLPIDTVWHHVAAVVDTDQQLLIIYIDGNQSLQQDIEGSISLNEGSLYLGSLVSVESGYASFLGKLSEVEIWNEAHDASQVVMGMYQTPNENDVALLTYVNFSNQSAINLPDIMNATSSDVITQQSDLQLNLPISQAIFGGENSYILCGQSGSNTVLNFSENTAFTVETWVKFLEINRNEGMTILGFCQDTIQYGFGVDADANLQFQRGSDILVSQVEMVPNTWTHLAGTYDGQVAQFYIDGILVATLNSSTSLPTSDGNFVIGSEYYSGAPANCFLGSIHSVKLWNIALAPGDVREEMQNNSFEAEQSYSSDGSNNLLGFFDFDYNLGTDYSVNQNNPVASIEMSMGATDFYTESHAFSPTLSQYIMSLTPDTSYASVDGAAITTASTFSIELWAQTTSGSTLISQEDSSGNTLFSISIDPGTGALQVASSASLSEPLGGGLAFDGNWHHVLLVSDSSTGTSLYLDGNVIGTSTTAIDLSGTDSSVPIVFGDQNLDPQDTEVNPPSGMTLIPKSQNVYNLNLAEIRLWSVAVNPAIAYRNAYIALSSAVYTDTSLIVGYWDFSANALIDLSHIYRLTVLDPQSYIQEDALQIIPARYALDVSVSSADNTPAMVVDTSYFSLTSFEGITFELWVKIDSLEGDTLTLLDGLDSNNDSVFSLNLSTQNELTFTGSGDTPYTANIPADIQDDNWHHIAVAAVNTGTQSVNLYIDGVYTLVSVSNSSSIFDITTVATLNVCENANLSLGMLRVWSQALELSVIQAGMNQYSSGMDVGLLGYWDFSYNSPADQSSFDAATTIGSIATITSQDDINNEGLTLNTAVSAANFLDQSSDSLPSSYCTIGSSTTNLQNSISFNNNDPFTIELWVQAQDLPASGDSACIISYGDFEDGSLQYALTIENNVFVGYRGGDTCTSFTNIQTGAWYDLVLTYDGQNLTIYVNQLQEGQIASSASLSDNSILPLVGAGESNSIIGNFFSGQIQWISIWDTGTLPDAGSQLSSQSLLMSKQQQRVKDTFSNLFQAGSAQQADSQAPVGDESGLKGLWKFDMAVNTDFSPSGNAISPMQVQGSNAATPSEIPFTTTSYYNDPSGYCLSFNGTDAYIDFSSSQQTPSLDSAVTIECWVMINQLDDSNPPMLPIVTSTNASYGAGNNEDYALYYDTQNEQIVFVSQAVSDSGTALSLGTGANTVPVGQWVQVAAVWDGESTASIYLNGQSSQSVTSYSGTIDTSANTSVFQIGGIIDTQNTQQYFDGSLTEVRIWNVARSNDDIATNWYRVTNLYEKDFNSESESNQILAGYWACNTFKSLNYDEAEKKTIPGETDLSNNNTDGSYVGNVVSTYFPYELQSPLPQIKAQSRFIQNWNETDQNGNNANGHGSFRTVISIIAPDNTVVPEINVSVWATSDKIQVGDDNSSDDEEVKELIEINVNGETYQIDSDTSASFTTNANGNVTIDMVGTALSCPTLIFWADFMDNDERVIINPDLDLHETINSNEFDGDYLQSAQNGSAPLLNKDTYDEETADSVATAMQNCVQTIKDPDGNDYLGSRYFSKHMYNGALNQDSNIFLEPDVQDQQVVTTNNEMVNRTIAAGEIPHWNLNINNTSAKYSVLTIQEVNALIGQWKPVHLNPNGESLSLSSLWNDFVDGVKEVESVVITTAEKGIEIVAKFTDGAIHAILDSAEAVGEAITGLLVGVINAIEGGIDALQRVLNFFRNTLDWDDIKITHQVVQTIMSGGIDAVGVNLNNGVKWMNSQLDSVKSEITKPLDDYINSSTAPSAQTLFDQNTTASTNPRTFAYGAGHASGYGVENNFIMDQLLSVWNNINAPLPEMTSNLSSLISNFGDTLIDSIQSFVTGDKFDEIKKEVGKAIDFFIEIMNNPSSFLTLALQGLAQIVKVIIETLMDSVSVIFSAIASISEAIIAFAKSILEIEYANIPILSWLYREVITDGEEFSLFGVLSLVAAVPATITYKLIYGTAPFSSQDVEKYRNKSFVLPSLTNSNISNSQDDSGLQSADPRFQALGTIWIGIDTVFDFLTSIMPKSEFFSSSSKFSGGQQSILLSTCRLCINFGHRILNAPPAGFGSSYNGVQCWAPDYGPNTAMWFLSGVRSLRYILSYLFELFDEFLFKNLTQKAPRFNFALKYLISLIAACFKSILGTISLGCGVWAAVEVGKIKSSNNIAAGILTGLSHFFAEVPVITAPLSPLADITKSPQLKVAAITINVSMGAFLIIAALSDASDLEMQWIGD